MNCYVIIGILCQSQWLVVSFPYKPDDIFFVARMAFKEDHMKVADMLGKCSMIIKSNAERNIHVCVRRASLRLYITHKVHSPKDI